MNTLTPKENDIVKSIFSAIQSENAIALDADGKNFIKNSKNLPTANFILSRIANDKKITVSIRSNAESIRKIKDFSKKNGVPYQTFLNAYIDEIADNLPN